MGGETDVRRDVVERPAGLSPRGRGNPLSQQLREHLPGSIPAWAGKPRYGGRARRAFGVYPRVGGETQTAYRVSAHHAGLSPRGRGNHIGEEVLDALPRSIPAWAGKPLLHRWSASAMRVYPRVGGETWIRSW